MMPFLRGADRWLYDLGKVIAGLAILLLFAGLCIALLITAAYIASDASFRIAKVAGVDWVLFPSWLIVAAILGRYIAPHIIKWLGSCVETLPFT